ncbi:MAG: ABC transporter ATP-binding protein [Rhodospirillales bacterium]|nr:ABC transporter ATP-binding protein [Rhodospirillales bacterium]
MTDSHPPALSLNSHPPALSLSGVTKRFPGVLANDAISLEVLAGEVHVLLGENGAGKSTLIAMLAGMQQPDAGEIRVAGRSVRIASPRESLALGIGTVFQHLLLVPSLTVLENLMLGGPWWRRLGRSTALARFRDLSALLGVTLYPDSPLARLSLGQQQQVAIMRALWCGSKVLILDEPTSMLTPRGVEELGRVMRRLRAAGTALIFVTHKLNEVYGLGDRVSVLRSGRLAGQLPPEQLNSMSEEEVSDAVIRLMFGRTESHDEEGECLSDHGRKIARKAPDSSARRKRLVAQEIATAAARGECPLRGVFLDLAAGEVLGIAGVDGNGQKHLAEALAGQRPLTGGSLILDGHEIGGSGVAARRRLGLRYITDERLGEGTVGDLSVAINLILKETGRPPLWQGGISRWGRIHAHARDRIERYDVRTPHERTPIVKLSGGNIQKVLLARELTKGEAAIAIFNKPTYGLDLQNTLLARERIVHGAEQGLATLVISTELDELLEVSDRIAVLLRGRIAGIVENGPGAAQRIGALMTGAEAA